MITIFGTPKPFCGISEIHQYNAISSWKRLTDDVLLLGNATGTDEACDYLGATHVPEVERNEFGTPLVSSLFSICRQRAKHDLICYVNADIILTKKFLCCLNAVRSRFARFLMVGRRWNLDVIEALEIGSPGFERDILNRATAEGKQATEWYIDYFAFPKSEFTTVPPFAVGRVRWDNWMIWKATASGLAVVDTSACVTAVHQNHDYSHYPTGEKGVYEGPEAETNHKLAGGWDHIYSIKQATHRMVKIRTSYFIIPEPVSKIKSYLNENFSLNPRLLKFSSMSRNAVQMILSGHWDQFWLKLKKNLNIR